ncbi:hypothetical protein LINGRAHAP2_LOCUS32710 [Linum grandiflorum]
MIMHCVPWVRSLQNGVSTLTLCELRRRICGSRVKEYRSMTRAKV